MVSLIKSEANFPKQYLQRDSEDNIKSILWILATAFQRNETNLTDVYATDTNNMCNMPSLGKNVSK